MRYWTEYGYSDSESDMIEFADEYSEDDAVDLYIEAKRKEYYSEFYQYLRENGVNPFDF